MEYLRVKNLERYQHYGTRNPPWIKLYRTMLSDYEMRAVPVPSRYCYVGCLILASETDNRIPYDLKYLSERMGMCVSESVLSPLIGSGFLLASGASRVLASIQTPSSLLSSVEETPLSDPSFLSSLPLKPPNLKSKDRSPKSAAAWGQYAASFLRRYSVEPVRNAKANSLLCRLVDRLGDEAPAVAGFYVTHDGLLYVRGKHCLDLLLRDAEGLRMEWATGRQVTNGQAALTDRTSTTGSIIKKLIDEEEAKHVNRHT